MKFLANRKTRINIWENLWSKLKFGLCTRTNYIWIKHLIMQSNTGLIFDLLIKMLVRISESPYWCDWVRVLPVLFVVLPEVTGFLLLIWDIYTEFLDPGFSGVFWEWTRVWDCCASLSLSPVSMLFQTSTQPKYLPVVNWLNKLQYIHLVKGSSTVLGNRELSKLDCDVNKIGHRTTLILYSFVKNV